MARRLDERMLQRLADALTERFGQPINARPGRILTCESCDGMMQIDEDTCSQCGMMDRRMPEGAGPARHPGHADSCTCPDCSRPEQPAVDEVAPPGREKQVRALKKKRDVDNPFAVAWASYDKSSG